MKRLTVCFISLVIAFISVYSQQVCNDSVRGKVMSYEKGDVRKGASSEMLRDRLSPRFSYPGNENTFCQKVLYDLSAYGLNGSIMLEVVYLFDIEQNIKTEAITVYGSPFDKKNDFIVEFPPKSFNLVFYDKEKKQLSIPLVFKDRETHKIIKQLVCLMSR